MIVYHGTDSSSAQNIVQNGIDLTYGDESVDNAQGFYTTPSKEFASRRAQVMTDAAKKFRKKDDLKPVVLEIDVNESAFEKLSIKKFSGETFQWKEFVLYNRLGKRFLRDQGIISSNHNLDMKYDVVIDETADAGIGSIVSNIRYKETRHNGDLKAVIEKIGKSDEACWDMQVSFHSYRAIESCIKSIKIIDV